MVCQRECFECGETDNVHWHESLYEFYCDDCIETMKADSK